MGRDRHRRIPSLLNTGGTSYPNVGYVHSGWWSEDKQTIFVHDELDERNRGLRTTLQGLFSCRPAKSGAVDDMEWRNRLRSITTASFAAIAITCPTTRAD